MTTSKSPLSEHATMSLQASSRSCTKVHFQPVQWPHKLEMDRVGPFDVEM